MSLKQDLAVQLPEWRDRVTRLVKEKGSVKIGEVNIGQVYGGMRDVRGLVSDISYVDPVEGIRLRGFTIPDAIKQLPKPAGAEMPYTGGLYYLLLIGKVPTREQALDVEREWQERGQVPGYVFEVIKAMPVDTHPMTLFSQAVLAMQRESGFARQYHNGLQRADYWEPTLEDSLNLTARLPEIAAFIYRWKYKHGETIPPEPELDWAANFAQMMGIENPQYKELSRLYFLLHSDHESGNVSAHATHLVGSALSDVYYATSAGLNGLAGPLHGLANQECLGWLLEVYKKYDGVPSREELQQFAWETLTSGQVIPGYGHAVLRRTDPRYTAQYEFGKKYMPEDDIFRLAKLVYEVVPEVLMEQGKARDPWPNVDAISGTLQYHYGVKEFDFYTVMFGVSRLLGVSANMVWARLLGQPIERPKSLTTAMLEELAGKG
ncbi:MAG TPA: citrate (Si)-synthase [Anaerolineales bacterium]|nr:citrate (Si)-synthase [Anaerolineales bacterium]